MFVNHEDWPGPPRWEPPPGPRPPRPREPGGREETVLLWVIGVNMALLFVAPIAGATVLQAAWALLGG